MKGMQMDSPWRTIQLFISSQYAGIFEVELDTKTKDIRCNCPVWIKNGSCKHTKFVNEKSKGHNGRYSISIPDTVDEDIVEEAINDPQKFRELILKYNTIEVL